MALQTVSAHFGWSVERETIERAHASAIALEAAVDRGDVETVRKLLPDCARTSRSLALADVCTSDNLEMIRVIAPFCEEYQREGILKSACKLLSKEVVCELMKHVSDASIESALRHLDKLMKEITGPEAQADFTAKATELRARLAKSAGTP